MSIRVFRWKAVDEQGLIRRGTLTGTDLAQIRAQLRRDGYYPLRIRPHSAWRPVGLLGARFRMNWSSFARRLSILLQAGIPLLNALDMVGASTINRSDQAELIQGLKERVAAGEDLSEALKAARQAPTPFVLAMVKAGEQTGALSRVLKDLADQLDRQKDFEKRIRVALSYPSLLLGGVALLVIALAVWVLPLYENLYVNLDADLPTLTKVVFDLGHALPWIGLGLVGLGLSLLSILWHRYPRTWRWELGRLGGSIPLVGAVRRKRDLVDFADVLSRLLGAGIPLLEALQLTREMMYDAKIIQLTDALIEGVGQGRRLAPILRTSPVFPPAACDMIGVAEETGSLDEMFGYVAIVFRADLEETLEHWVKRLEPGLLVIMAGLVGLVAVGVLLPVFEAGTYVQ